MPAPRPQDQHKYDNYDGVWIRKEEFPLTEEEELELIRRMSNVVVFMRREGPQTPERG